MTTGGWIIMTCSVAFVTLFLAWTLFKVITTPEADAHLHSQADIDPHDQE